MLTIKKGNIFNSNCEILVCPVNCEGVMGKGLALQFKNRFPDVYLEYNKYCRYNKFLPGNLFLYKNVLCFPTKNKWRFPSNIKWVEQGLDKFIDTYKNLEIKSIAFPLLGAGLGGLNQDDVLSLMKTKLNDLNIECEIWLN